MFKLQVKHKSNNEEWQTIGLYQSPEYANAIGQYMIVKNYRVI